MKWQPINIVDKLTRVQLKTQSESAILQEVKRILNEDNNKEICITTQLNSKVSKTINHFNIDALESHRIYDLEAIKKVCVDYRLRFLDSHFFKPAFPYEAICEIKALEKTHQITLKGFKIVAPAKLLKLENADDPLLFAPIGNGYYYLVHQWGNDLHPLRKWFMKPFKTIENLLLTTLIVSALLTLLLPQSSTPNTGGMYFILFLFMFKSVVGIVIYYAFSKGKNVSVESWNSKYYNG